MVTSFILLGLAIFALFRKVHAFAAVALLVLVAIGAGVTLVNLLNHFAALLVATDPAYAGVSGPTSDALALLWLDLHEYGYTADGILFGLWLLPLGYLAYVSGMFPQALGMLLMISCFCYLANTFALFLIPDLNPTLSAIVTAPTAIAEFWMVGYLLLVGVRGRGITATPAPVAD